MGVTWKLRRVPVINWPDFKYKKALLSSFSTLEKRNTSIAESGINMSKTQIAADGISGEDFKSYMERTLAKISPLELADNRWDNVGWLMEQPSMLINPLKPSKNLHANIHLTNDLTPDCCNEAIKNDVRKNGAVSNSELCSSTIITYHPFLFDKFNRISSGSSSQNSSSLVWRNSCVWSLIGHWESLASRTNSTEASPIAAANGVYSVHTVLDAVRGGVNDWLLGSAVWDLVDDNVVTSEQDNCNLHLKDFVDLSHMEPSAESLDLISASMLCTSREYSNICNDCQSTARLYRVGRVLQSHPSPSVSSKYPLSGFGRVAHLVSRDNSNEPVTLANLVTRFMKYSAWPIPENESVTGANKTENRGCRVVIGLGATGSNMRNHPRQPFVLKSADSTRSIQSTKISALSSITINEVAVCAGSGGSVFRDHYVVGRSFNHSHKPNQTLLVTGEISHHQALEFQALGYNLLLLEHSNTERRYLHEVYTHWLAKALEFSGAQRNQSSAESSFNINIDCLNNDRDPIDYCFVEV